MSHTVFQHLKDGYAPGNLCFLHDMPSCSRILQQYDITTGKHIDLLSFIPAHINPKFTHAGSSLNIPSINYWIVFISRSCKAELPCSFESISFNYICPNTPIFRKPVRICSFRLTLFISFHGHKQKYNQHQLFSTGCSRNLTDTMNVTTSKR